MQSGRAIIKVKIYPISRYIIGENKPTINYDFVFLLVTYRAEHHLLCCKKV